MARRAWPVSDRPATDRRTDGRINNLAVSSPDEIAGGLRQITAAIHRRSPDTQILLLGMLPSGESANHPRRARILRANAMVSTLGDGLYVHYLDIGAHFLNDRGEYTPQVSFDAIHLTHSGYAIWARCLRRPLGELLGKAWASLRASALLWLEINPATAREVLYCTGDLCDDRLISVASHRTWCVEAGA